MSKLYEEVNPFQFTGKGKMDVRDAAVRDNINTLLTGALMACTLTPYIALEKVRKVLAYFHISIPGTSFMEGDRGIKTFEVEQFGLKFGIKNDGQIVNFNSVDKDMTHGAHIDGENFNYVTAPGTENTDEKFHIYFEYKMNDKGMFDVFSEIVTDDELEDLLDDAEEDINADKSEDDREERLNEAVMPKIKRFFRKVSGKQRKEMTDKLDIALDDRQIKTLGHKVNMDNPSDREKLRKDERYRELNRRYISAKYGVVDPGYRKLTSRYMRGDKKKVDEAKNIATKVLNELRLHNPDGSSSINLPEPLSSGLEEVKHIRETVSMPLRGLNEPSSSPSPMLRTQPRPGAAPDPLGSIRHVSGTLKQVGPPGTPSMQDLAAAVRPSELLPPTTGSPSPVQSSSVTHPSRASSSVPVEDGNEKPGASIPTGLRFSRDKTQSKPMTSAPMTPEEMKSVGYSQKIQETSHETVNHVRRLAMKNSKLKEDIGTTTRRPNPLASAARSTEAPGQPGSAERQASADTIGRTLGNFIPGAHAVSHASQGNYGKAATSAAIDAATTYTGLKLGINAAKAVGKAAEPFVSPFIGKVTQSTSSSLASKPVTAAGYYGKKELDNIQSNNPQVTPLEKQSPEELDKAQKAAFDESTHETVNHVRRLAMKNKRNDR